MITTVAMALGLVSCVEDVPQDTQKRFSRQNVDNPTNADGIIFGFLWDFTPYCLPFIY